MAVFTCQGVVYVIDFSQILFVDLNFGTKLLDFLWKKKLTFLPKNTIKWTHIIS